MWRLERVLIVSSKEDVTYVQFLTEDGIIAAISGSKLFLWNVNTGIEILKPINIPMYSSYYKWKGGYSILCIKSDKNV